MGIALHITVNLVFAVMVLVASLGRGIDGESLLVASDPSPGPVVAAPQMHGRGMTELAAGAGDGRGAGGVGPASGVLPSSSSTSEVPATTATTEATTTTVEATTTTVQPTTTVKATTTTVRPSTTVPAVDVAADGDGPPSTPRDRFDRLAHCESTLNPRAVSPGGRYRGAFQFSMPTWRSAGGTGDPIDHSYAHQKQMAIHWSTQADPFTQWPVCWPRTL